MLCAVTTLHKDGRRDDRRTSEVSRDECDWAKLRSRPGRKVAKHTVSRCNKLRATELNRLFEVLRRNKPLCPFLQGRRDDARVAACLAASWKIQLLVRAARRSSPCTNMGMHIEAHRSPSGTMVMRRCVCLTSSRT